MVNCCRAQSPNCFINVGKFEIKVLQLLSPSGLLPRPVESYIPRAGFRNLYLLSSLDTCGTKPSKSLWTGAEDELFISC